MLIKLRSTTISPIKYHLVNFEPPGIQIAVPEGASLLEAAARAGIKLWATCSGQGTCGQCSLIITSGEIPAPTEEEFEYLTTAELQSQYRLACCVRVLTAMHIYVPVRSIVPKK